MSLLTLLVCGKWVNSPEGHTPYNGLYGEAPPEKDTFFTLQVHERVGKSVI